MNKNTFLFIENAHEWLHSFSVDGGYMEEPGKPLGCLNADNKDGDTIKITNESVPEKLYNSLKFFSHSTCEFTAPCFSNEMSFDELMDCVTSQYHKYLFRYAYNKAQCFDSQSKTWYNVRSDPDALNHLRIISNFGNFILGLDHMSIYWYFNCNDVRDY